MTTDQLFERISGWINNKILPNPSGQDQVKDHFLPLFFATSLLISIPWGIGIYAGLLAVGYSLVKEFIEDGHWRDLFSKTESGADGRVDLAFRLGGCGIAYLTLLWS
jgi:hypothetical protein